MGMINWKEKVVINTGMGSRIGKTFALILANHGAILIVTDINEEKAKQVAEICKTSLC